MEPKKMHPQKINVVYYLIWVSLKYPNHISVVKMLAVVIELVDCINIVHMENYEEKKIGFDADVRRRKIHSS